jgi:hypothetical protein
MTAFEEGTTATLTVTIYNNYWWASTLNVSAVKVYMDWNVNYSSTEVDEDDPFLMPYNTYHTFTITFTVPAVTVASNLIWHGYTIYVEELDADDDVLSHDTWAGTGFIIYSADQKDAMLLYDEINVLYDTYGWNPSFSNQEAYDLWRSGRAQYETALNSHYTGDFSGALTHYGLALDAFNDALATESAYDTEWQDYEDDYDKQWDAFELDQQEAQAAYYWAQANYYATAGNASLIEAEASQMEAEASMKLADAAMMNAYGWMIFGFGFIVFGIAACIWAYRRPTHTT